MKITCLCDTENEIDIPAEFDADADPTVIGKILDGSFLTFTCKSCGKKLKPEAPVRIVSAAGKFDLFLVPEEERISYLNGKTAYRAGTAAGVTSRIVIGFPELVEKLKVIEAGLDDRAVEVIKYYLLLKADETHPDTEILLYFHERRDDKLVFHVHGLKADEVGVMNVPFQNYVQVVASLGSLAPDDPAADIIKLPYVSVTNAFD